MMQIVIDIQEDDFEKIKNTSFVEDPEIMLRQSLEDRKDTMMLFRVMDAIKHGTPLPKGHGRLIDAKEVYKNFYCRCLAGVATEVLNETSTIIEAEKAESEVENAE